MRKKPPRLRLTGHRRWRHRTITRAFLLGGGKRQGFRLVHLLGRSRLYRVLLLVAGPDAVRCLMPLIFWPVLTRAVVGCA